MRERGCQARGGGGGRGGRGSALVGGGPTVLVSEGCTLPPARLGRCGVWAATRGARVRPCMRGAERRTLWLMCPIKLLSTLWRQLLPVGPWVQIGSVSLPRGCQRGRRAVGGRLSQHAAGLLPLAQPGPAPAPWRICSLQYPSGLPGPACLLTVLALAA